MVSIDPVTSSDVSTLFAAKCVDVIAPSAMIVPEIAFTAINSVFTFVVAITFHPMLCLFRSTDRLYRRLGM